MEGVVETAVEVGVEVVVEVGVEVSGGGGGGSGRGRRLHLFHLEAALRLGDHFGVREILLAHLDELAARAAEREAEAARAEH